jgi:hypothetical protein
MDNVSMIETINIAIQNKDYEVIKELDAHFHASFHRMVLIMIINHVLLDTDIIWLINQLDKFPNVEGIGNILLEVCNKSHNPIFEQMAINMIDQNLADHRFMQYIYHTGIRTNNAMDLAILNKARNLISKLKDDHHFNINSDKSVRSILNGSIDDHNFLDFMFENGLSIDNPYLLKEALFDDMFDENLILHLINKGVKISNITCSIHALYQVMKHGSLDLLFKFKQTYYADELFYEIFFDKDFQMLRGMLLYRSTSYISEVYKCCYVNESAKSVCELFSKLQSDKQLIHNAIAFFAHHGSYQQLREAIIDLRHL